MYVGSIEITGGTKEPALGTSAVDDFLLIEFNLIYTKTVSEICVTWNNISKMFKIVFLSNPKRKSDFDILSPSDNLNIFRSQILQVFYRNESILCIR